MPDSTRRDAVYDLGTRHAAVESAGDLEATMATLVAEPEYEFLPMGWTMSGSDMVRRYYRPLMSSFIPSPHDFELIDKWVSEASVAQEYRIDVEVDGAVESHRVVGILWVDGDLLGGERIYASERCARLMAGDDLIDEISRA